MSEIEIIKDHGKFKSGDVLSIETSIAFILSKKGYCKIIKSNNNNKMVKK